MDDAAQILAMFLAMGYIGFMIGRCYQELEDIAGNLF